MLIYYCFIISIILWGLFTDSSYDRVRRVSRILVIIQLIIFQGIRSYDVGIDTRMYERIYKYVGSSSKMFGYFGIEPGYMITCKLFSLAGCSFRAFLIFVTVFCVVSYCVFINRYCENFYLGTLIYVAMGYYFRGWDVIRQEIAICIILWSIKYIIEEKYIKVICYICLAFLFHRSAVVFILIILCNKILGNDKLSKDLIIKIGILVSSLVGLPIAFNIARKYIPRFNGVIDFSGKPRYLLMIIAIYIAFTVLLYDCVCNDNVIKLMYNMLFVACLFQTLSIYSNTMSRITEFFDVSLIILLPFMINRVVVKNRGAILSHFFVWSLSMIYFSVSVILDLEPYTTMFSKARW